MAKFNIGDKVRIKTPVGWPTTYALDNATGTVVKFVDYDEPMQDFQDYIYVHLENAEGEGKTYIGNKMFFMDINMEKI